MIDYTIIMVNVLKIKNKSKSVNHKKKGKRGFTALFFVSNIYNQMHLYLCLL